MAQANEERTETIMGLIDADLAGVREVLRASASNDEFDEQAALLGDLDAVVEIAHQSIRALAREPSESAALRALTDVGALDSRMTSIMAQSAMSAMLGAQSSIGAESAALMVAASLAASGRGRAVVPGVADPTVETAAAAASEAVRIVAEGARRTTPDTAAFSEAVRIVAEGARRTTPDTAAALEVGQLVVGYLQAIIQRVSSHVLQLISGLVTPKEWSLSRDLNGGGTPGVSWAPYGGLPFGSRGTTIQMTFGR